MDIFQKFWTDIHCIGSCIGLNVLETISKVLNFIMSRKVTQIFDKTVIKIFLHKDIISMSGVMGILHLCISCKCTLYCVRLCQL